MNNKKILGMGLFILMITLGAFWVSTGLNFSDEEIIWLDGKPEGIDTVHTKPKQEIRQVFEYRWDQPVDSCSGSYPFFWQVRFDPLPEVNKPTKIYVKLKSCWEWKTDDKYPNIFVIAGEGIMDFTQLEPTWIPPIKKGDIYEGSITIIPREIGRHGITIALITGEASFQFGFYENGELAHLSERGSFPKSDLPNHPAITDNDIYVKFNGQYITNLFHIVPPLSLNDTSTVYYRVITKDYYPDGMKIVTRDGKISYKMLPGPITKGDTLEGFFKVVPSRSGANGFALDIEEPPREGVKPKNDRFIARYHLDKDGKLLYIVKTQKESKIFFKYFKKKGVTVGEY